MEISEKLLKFKFHILFTIAFSLIYLAPRFLDVLAYFWPLSLHCSVPHHCHHLCQVLDVVYRSSS
ncbi:hypothetical protein ACSBR2_011995 [Camellia fascicularis]